MSEVEPEVAEPEMADEAASQKVEAKEPLTIVVSGDLDQMMIDAERMLPLTNDPPELFRRASVLTRIGRDDADNQPIITPWRAAGFKAHLASVANWVKFDRDGNEYAVHPPDSVVQALLELADQQDKIPVVEQVVRCPIFAPNGELVMTNKDGELVMTPGYSEAARVWYQPDPLLIIPKVSKRPTGDEVLEARHRILDDLLVDFPFKALPGSPWVMAWPGRAVIHRGGSRSRS